MRNRIEVSNSGEGKLSFFLSNEKGRFYLCQTRYHEAVYKYFSPGRSEQEVRKFKYWGSNMHLRKIVERLPKNIDYVMKYEVES